MYKLKEDGLIAVVDMIEGFINFGALSSPEIKSIVEPMRSFLQNTKENKIFLVDSHNEEAEEFKDFPPHCIKGSGEDKVISELEEFAEIKFMKNSFNAFHSEQFRSYLIRNMDKYRNYYIIGCCTDICVLNLALTMKTYFNEHNLANEVYVIRELVETFNLPDHDQAASNESAISVMKTNGVKVISLRELNV